MQGQATIEIPRAYPPYRRRLWCSRVVDGCVSARVGLTASLSWMLGEMKCLEVEVVSKAKAGGR